MLAAVMAAAAGFAYPKSLHGEIPADLRDAPFSPSALGQLGGDIKELPPVAPPGRDIGARTGSGLKPLPAKEWTIMLFMNGKNNLKDAMGKNVNMLESVGSDSNVNIVVELGLLRGGDTGSSGRPESRRFYITRDSDPGKITSKTFQASGKADMGDYKRVVDFVNWSKAGFPARKYMLVIANHGMGWINPRQASKGVSFDNGTNNYIRTKELGRILRESGMVDILAFDACFMQAGEVAAEIGNNAAYIIGSEEAIPEAGLPYGLALKVLEQRPDMSAREFSGAIAENYIQSYRQQKQGAHFSVIRTDKIEGFNELAGKFAALAVGARDAGALAAALPGMREGYDRGVLL